MVPVYEPDARPPESARHLLAGVVTLDAASPLALWLQVRAGNRPDALLLSVGARRVAFDVVAGLRLDDGGFEALQLVILGFAVLTTTLAAAVWGVARRRGTRWVLGLAVAPVVAVVQYLLREPFSEAVRSLVEGLPGAGSALLGSLLIGWAWSLLPPFAAGLTCWRLEQADRTEQAGQTGP